MIHINPLSYVYVGPCWCYRKIFNMRRTLVGNKIVDHFDVVGASPVVAAPTTSSFLTKHLASVDWAKTTARRDGNHLIFGFGAPYIRDVTVAVLGFLVGFWEPRPNNRPQGKTKQI